MPTVRVITVLPNKYHGNSMYCKSFTIHWFIWTLPISVWLWSFVKLPCLQSKKVFVCTYLHCTIRCNHQKQEILNSSAIRNCEIYLVKAKNITFSSLFPISPLRLTSFVQVVSPPKKSIPQQYHINNKLTNAYTPLSGSRGPSPRTCAPCCPCSGPFRDGWSFPLFLIFHLHLLFNLLPVNLHLE